MSKHFLWVLALVPIAASAGNAPVVAFRAGPSAVAAPSQAQTGAIQTGGSDAGQATQATQVSVSFSRLPGAYDAAIANGAVPNANGNVEVTISDVSLTIDRKDAVVPR